MERGVLTQRPGGEARRAERRGLRWLPAVLTTDPDAERPDALPKRSTRDWLVDTVCFLFAGCWGILVSSAVLTTGAAPDESLLFADQIAAALACAALWTRRRWPVGLALALLPISVFSELAGGAILVAIFTVAVHRRWPAVLLVVSLHGLAMLPYYALRPEDGTPYWVSVAVTLLICLVLVASGMLVRARRQLVISLRERARRAETEARLRADRARHLERERIAREMHDVLAHRISLLSVHAGALEFRPDAPPEKIASAAATIRDSARQALEDLREVLGVLRGGQLADGEANHPQPTLADVAGLVEESAVAGMRVRLVAALDDGALELESADVPATVGRTVYRLVQEGLTNARKHADGAEVTVSITGSAGHGIEVLVHNPVTGHGVGLPTGGAGLVGLAERVELAGGRLTFGQADGEFRLHTWLPWRG
ncbi:sensor histidine kinase [Tamaricihabitans halophyticus]|nr:histidine kinase [Tamaricihabitans halophyticus]